MKGTPVFILGLAISFFCGSVSLLAQDYEAQLLGEIQKAYDNLNHVEAEIKAKTALRQYQRFTPAQLTEIHRILALVYFSQNNTEKARQHFENALSINPNIELDLLFVSPKIVEFFERVKGQRQNNHRDDIQPQPEIRYILLEDLRAAAALRSMALPGWGQMYKKERQKGLVLTTLWGVGILGTVVTHLARSDAENRYLAESDPARIDDRFNTFNRLHKLRNGLLLFSAGVWLYSYVDAFLKKTAVNGAPSHLKKTFSVVPTLSTNSANLTIRLKL